MASTVDDTGHSINKVIANHATINILLQLSDVIPSTNIVALERFDPVEHARDPFQFLVLLAGTNGIGGLAEINVGIPAITALIARTLAKVEI